MSMFRTSPFFRTRSPGMPAVLQDAVARNAVADLVVDRGADRLRERAVARRGVVKGGRNRALHADHVVVAQPVQFAGGDSGPDVGSDEIEHFGRQAAGQAHALDVRGSFDDDGHDGGRGLG